MINVVIHFDAFRFVTIKFGSDRAAAQKYVNKAVRKSRERAADAPEPFVSLAIFRENKMVFIYTPITDDALIER